MIAIALAILLHTGALREAGNLLPSDYRLRDFGIPTAQPHEESTLLESGKQVSAEMSRGETRRYRLVLNEGAFVTIRLNQEGIDLGLLLYGPDQKVAGEIKKSSQLNDSKSLSLLVTRSGVYFLEVRPLSPAAKSGKYRLVYETPNLEPKSMESSVPTQPQIDALVVVVRAIESMTAGDRAAWQGSVSELELHMERIRQIGDQRIEMLAWLEIGVLKGLMENYNEGVEALERAARLTHESGDRAAEGTLLLLIGAEANLAGDKQRALRALESALSLKRDSNDRFGLAAVLLGLGHLNEVLGKSEQALMYYQESVPIWKESGFDAGLAAAMTFSGSVYASRKMYLRAIESYRSALVFWRRIQNRPEVQPESSIIAGVLSGNLSFSELSNRVFSQVQPPLAANGEGITFLGLGRASAAQREWTQARDSLRQALLIFEKTRLKGGQAAAFSDLASVAQNTGKTDDAVEFYKQELALRRESKDRRGEALALLNLGSLSALTGNGERALEFYDQLRVLSHDEGIRDMEPLSLVGVGMAYTSLGEPRKAINYLNLARTLAAVLGDRETEPNSWLLIGSSSILIGEQQRALEAFKQSVALLRGPGPSTELAVALVMVAAAYHALGDPQSALRYLREARTLMKGLRDHEGEATTLLLMGEIYSLMGEHQKALHTYLVALPAARATHNGQWINSTLVLIGSYYLRQRKYQLAIALLTEALSVADEAKDLLGSAKALATIGLARVMLSDINAAAEAFDQALSLYRKIGDPAGEASVLANKAEINRRLGRFSEARSLIESALGIVESVRGKLTIDEFRSSYFATVGDYYEFDIDLLMQEHERHPGRGYAKDALQIAERARARGLLDLLAEAQADIGQDVDPALIAREQEIREELGKSADEQMGLISGSGSAAPGNATTRKIEDLTEEWRDLKARIKAASLRYAELAFPPPRSVNEIQSLLLDANSALLYYSLGSRRSYLWMVTRNSVTSYVLPTRKVIERASRDFYRQLATWSPSFTQPKNQRASSGLSPDERLARSGMTLSRLVLGPVASVLGNRRLLIVTDGALEYVPFSALPDPGQSIESRVNNRTVKNASYYAPVILEHETVNLPSATTAAYLRQTSGAKHTPTKRIAVFADPVFEPGDSRFALVRQGGIPKCGSLSGPLASASAGLSSDEKRGAAKSKSRQIIPRLPFSRDEGCAVASLFTPSEAVLEMDFDATRSKVLSMELQDYDSLHFATHAFVDAKNPALSGVILAMVDEHGQKQNGVLRLADIYSLKLRARLVVLSACETALGKNIRGEGLIGLTRGFIYAGAERVIAGLWRVDDRATTELMKRFYQNLYGTERMSAGQALRAAQIEMIKSRRWHSPYYWSGFVLQGDGK